MHGWYECVRDEMWQKHSGWRRQSGAALLGVALLLALFALHVAQSPRGMRSATQAAPSSQVVAASAAPIVNRATISSSSAPLLTSQELAPARLVIPKMHLDAPILALGPDPTGAMQAPRIGPSSNPIWSEVYWWDVGAMPGQPGSAVIAGHVNRPDGSASTFTALDALVPGDTIQVVTVSGRVLNFVVTAKDTPLVYLHGGNDPTVQRIFGPSPVPHLNLLTCWGEWDGHDYNRRLVVYSSLIGASPFPPSPGTAALVSP